MKRFISLFVLCLFVLSLALSGCKKKEKAEGTTSQPTQEQTQQPQKQQPQPTHEKSPAPEGQPGQTQQPEQQK